MRDSSWTEQWRQIGLIARATFGGFLQSDLMPAGMQASSAIWAAAFLAAPALFPCTQDLVKYNFLRRFHPQIVEATLWSDRSLFLLLSAGAMGIIAVVMWDTLFPSRRDVFALGPLPVESRVQSAGRLGGLLTLFGMFVVALNALPALLFPLVSSGNFVGIFRDLIGHVVTTTAADAFVFFGLTTVQGLLIVATSRRAAERLAPILQTGAVLLLLIGLLFFGPLRGATTRALAEGDLTNPVLRWCPLAWFVGLYETISGTSRPVMHALALRGLLAGIGALGATIALYVFAFRRLCARAIETSARSTSSGLVTLVAAVVRRVFIRHPVEQAICGFTLRVLTRSRRHRMLLSIYVGGALALIAAGLLPEIFGTRTGIFRQPTVGTLAAPLIVSAAPGGRVPHATGNTRRPAGALDLPDPVHPAAAGDQRCAQGGRNRGAAAGGDDRLGIGAAALGTGRCLATRGVLRIALPVSARIAPAVVSRRAVRPGLRPRRLALPHVVAALSVRLHRLHLFGGRRRARAPS